MLGTASRRQDVNPPMRADALADLVLPDSDGRDLRVGDLWRERPVVLVWLRHYG